MPPRGTESNVIRTSIASPSTIENRGSIYTRRPRFDDVLPLSPLIHFCASASTGVSPGSAPQSRAPYSNSPAGFLGLRPQSDRCPTPDGLSVAGAAGLPHPLWHRYVVHRLVTRTLTTAHSPSLCFLKGGGGGGGALDLFPPLPDPIEGIGTSGPPPPQLGSETRPIRRGRVSLPDCGGGGPDVPRPRWGQGVVGTGQGLARRPPIRSGGIRSEGSGRWSRSSSPVEWPT